MRFGLEGLFLVALAIALGLAGLGTGWIVLVMAIGWLLVALVDFTAERISASPLSYLLPQRAEAPAAEPEASWPMPEERTVVAPPPERPERAAGAGAGAGARARTRAAAGVARAGRRGARGSARAAAPVPLVAAPPRARRRARALGAAAAREAAPAPVGAAGEPGSPGGRGALRQPG